MKITGGNFHSSEGITITNIDAYSGESVQFDNDGGVEVIVEGNGRVTVYEYGEVKFTTNIDGPTYLPSAV